MLSKRLGLVFFVLLSTRGWAQVPTVLLREGDVVAPGLTVSRINRNDTNRVGGWVTFAVATQPGGNKVSSAWGSPDGVQAPAVLLQEGPQAGYTQTNWPLSAKIDDQGRLGYQADLAGNLTSIWHHDVPIAVQNEPASIPGTWSSFLGEAGVTDAGDPWFLESGSGLFLGAAAAPLYLTGDPLPGTPDTIGWLRRFAFSSDSAHHLVTMNRSSPGGNQVFVLDGAGLAVGGSLLETNTVLPAALNGNGTDFYDFVYAVDVNASAQWCAVVRRRLGGVVASDEIVRNGQVLYKEGGVLDGVELRDVDWAADLTDRGELLHVWGQLPFPPETIFVDGDRIVGMGDCVDFDGDGLVDPNATIAPPTGNERWDATLSEDGWVYFSADIRVVQPGGSVDVLDAFLRVPRSPAPSSYCTPKLSSSGCAAALRTSDPKLAPVAGSGGYSLLATTVEGQRNGLFFWGTNGPLAVPFLGGTLCVQPPLNRTPIQTSGGSADTCSGSFVLELNGGDAWDLGPGQTTWWQAWYRDPDLADGFDVALSNGIEVQAR